MTVTNDEWITGDRVRMDRWTVGRTDGWRVGSYTEITRRSSDLALVDRRIGKLEKMNASTVETIYNPILSPLRRVHSKGTI